MCYCSYHLNAWHELLSDAVFAYYSAISDVLSVSLFEADFVFVPKSLFEFISGSEVLVETVEKLEQNLKSPFDDSQCLGKLGRV